MKFTKSNLCTERKYCEVCRQTETGREWRTLIGRIYETAGPDFACEFGMPWIVDGQTFDPKAVEVKATVKLPMDYGNLGERIMKREMTLKGMLPNSRLVVAIDEVHQAERGGGCTGCNRGRFMRKLGEFARTLSEEEKLVISRVIEKPS